MKKIYFKIAAFVLVFFIASGAAGGAFVTAKAVGSMSSQAYSQRVFGADGFVIRCFDRADFPMRSPFVSLTPEEQLADILDFAVQNGYATVYFEALAYANAMYRSSVVPMSPGVKDGEGTVTIDNPLKTVSELCRARGLNLVAVVDPFYVGQADRLINEERIFASRSADYTVTTPDGEVYYDLLNENVREHMKRIIEELAKRYDVDGILVDGAMIPQQAEESMGAGVSEVILDLFGQFSRTLAESERDVALAVSVEASYIDGAAKAEPESWISAGAVDCIILKNAYTVSDDEKLYQENLVYWKTLAEMTGVSFAAFISTDDIRTPSVSGRQFSDDDELFFELYANSLCGVGNAVFSGYSALSADGALLANKIVQSRTFSYPDLEDELAISRTLKITRPSDRLTWTGKKYFIMGTSDPAYPLFFNGEEVRRLGSKGTFGVLVDVEIGENVYTFTQNGESASTVIVRPDPEQGATTIGRITQSSVFPQVSRGIRAGDKIKLTCVAPSNGYVTANVNGERIVLEQVAAASSGVPAVYSAEYTVPAGAYAANKVTNVGPIVYRLNYNGETSSVESPGELVVVGKDADFIIRTSDYNGNVYYDTDDLSVFMTTLRRGTLDYVVDCTDDGYYVLASGGFLAVKSAEVVEDEVMVENIVSDYSVEYGERAEKLVFRGTAGAPYHAELEDGALAVTLYNTSGIDSVEMPSSELVSSVEVSRNENENSVSMRFILRDGAKLWGYSVEFEMENNAELETEAAELDATKTMIWLSKAPALSDDRTRPLEGLRVVIDPGHGGTDPGALGFGGVENGPTEANLNLFSAMFAKARLEQLGATVILLERPEDGKLSLEQRLSAAMDAKPDFFISLHHNSTGETVDSNEISGTTVYYHFPASGRFAQYLAANISNGLARKNNGARLGYYYVTRMSSQPSVLIELSFMVNSAEYESTCEQISLYKTAYAIADSVIAAIQTF